MKNQATHPKFKEWQTREFDLDYVPEIIGKSVMVKGQLFNGAKYFPLSCVNVDGFMIEIPVWLLKKNNVLHF